MKVFENNAIVKYFNVSWEYADEAEMKKVEDDLFWSNHRRCTIPEEAKGKYLRIKWVSIISMK